MKYMLLMNHVREGSGPGDWTDEERRASGAWMMSIHQELVENGEFVAAEGLTGPEAARIVTDDGSGSPVVTDGPFPESKEFLAGYWLVDVESPQRAIEIAARTSAAPGAGGRPSARPIEVRPVMDRPDRQG